MTNSSTLNIQLNFSLNDKDDFVKAFALIKNYISWDVLARFNFLAKAFNKLRSKVFGKKVAAIEHRVIEIGLNFCLKLVSQLVH